MNHGRILTILAQAKEQTKQSVHCTKIGQEIPAEYHTALVMENSDAHINMPNRVFVWEYVMEGGTEDDNVAGIFVNIMNGDCNTYIETYEALRQHLGLL